MSLVITDLCKRYGDVAVFSHVSLTVDAGEFVAILGESGVGKSTLLNCMAGLDNWDSGSVLLDGQDLGALNDEQKARMRREKTGFVFQAFHVLPHLDVAQNVGLPLLLLGQHDQARVLAMLDAVGLSGLGTRLPQQLSGGQLQRVAIARALACEPKIMLFDEPTSSLDPELTGEVLKVMRDLAADGMTMVVVSHEIGFAASVAHRITFLDQGRLLLQGTPGEVFGKPRHPRLDQFLDTYLDRGAAMLV